MDHLFSNVCKRNVTYADALLVVVGVEVGRRRDNGAEVAGQALDEQLADLVVHALLAQVVEHYLGRGVVPEKHVVALKATNG